jgi:Skp family chaperone for outer membrane proteins
VTKYRVLAALAAIVLAAGLLVSEASSQGVGNPATLRPVAPATAPSAAGAGMTAAMPAAAPAAMPASGPIALLDVSKVYKSHARFKGMMDQMKAHVEKVEEWVKGERDAIRTMAEKLKELTPGTQDYKDLEAQVAKRQSDLQVNMQLQRKELMLQEAKIYHNVYTEIAQEVESVAAARGFLMVLRYNGDEVDTQDPEGVLRDINKSVIWFNRGVDITDEVMARITSRSQQFGSAATGSTTNRPGIPAAPQRR